MKLDRDVKFFEDLIMPICLPVTDDKSDVVRNKGDMNIYIYIFIRVG